MKFLFSILILFSTIFCSLSAELLQNPVATHPSVTVGSPVQVSTATLNLRNPQTGEDINSFFPLGDVAGKPDSVDVVWSVSTGTVLNIKIYNLRGSLVRILVNNKSITQSNNKGKENWNGRDNYGKTVPAGIYIIYLEAIEQDTGRVTRATAPIAIGRRL